MSYILEALRKADAERERGSVPDLHAQLLPLSVSDAEVARPRSALGLWLGLGAAVAAAAGAAWFFLGGDEPGSAAPLVAVATAPPAALPPPPPRAEIAVAPVPQAPPAVQPEPLPPKPVAKPKPTVPVPVKAAPPAKPPAPKKAESVSMAEPLAPPARLLSLAELPLDLRQQVPQLVVGGSVYSPQASARMLVINGQVFQEGNSLAPELKLEQIRQKTAVFSIRGQRFEIPL